MPYALPVMADYSYSGPSPGPGPGRSTPGRRGGSPTQTPLGLIGQYTDYSERREQHMDMDFSRSLAAFDAEMRPKSARVALFEKSLASPSLTPNMATYEVCVCVCICVCAFALLEKCCQSYPIAPSLSPSLHFSPSPYSDSLILHYMLHPPLSPSYPHLTHSTALS